MMGAYSVFICKTCKKASYQADGTSWPLVNKERGLTAWNKEHEGHDTSVESDAHGQISPEEYEERLNDGT